MEKTRKRLTQRGITLVALVVTIVVLLILAGITINLLMTDTGILARAQSAKQAMEKAQFEERLMLVEVALGPDKILEGKITPEQYFEEAKKQGLISNADLTDINNDNIKEIEAKIEGNTRYEVITEDGYVYEIEFDTDGNIETEYQGKADKLPPRIKEIVITNKSTNHIEVQVTVNRLEGGKLTYLYKKDTEAESSYRELKKDTTDLIANFTGLEQNVIYNIKIIAENKNGQHELVVSEVTGEIPSGTITQKGETTWSSGKASIELETSETGYTLQYQINSREGTWQEYTGAIGNLNHGDIVYARLYDGINGSAPAVVNIEDLVVPQLATISLSSTSTAAGTAINAAVTHKDNESGIAIANCKWVYNTNPNNIGTDAAIYTGGTFSSSPQTISLKASTAGTYYLHLLSTDIAGNKKETISSAITIQTIYLVDKVNIGDYVAYEAGNWSTTVASPNSSTGNATFGGYAAESDKGKSIQGSKSGWRVLSKTGSGKTGNVTLVSAGIPVLGYYGSSSETNMNNMYKALDNFANTNYLNTTFASSARSVKKADMKDLETADSLAIGVPYWLKDAEHFIERKTVSRKVLYWIHLELRYDWTW